MDYQKHLEAFQNPEAFKTVPGAIDFLEVLRCLIEANRQDVSYENIIKIVEDLTEISSQWRKGAESLSGSVAGEQFNLVSSLRVLYHNIVEPLVRIRDYLEQIDDPDYLSCRAEIETDINGEFDHLKAELHVCFLLAELAIPSSLEVDLPTCLEEICSIHIAENKMDVKIEIPPGICSKQRLPAYELFSILENFLTNAARYGRKSGEEKANIVLSVSGEAGSNNLRFSVTDQGDGIAPELLPRIFDFGVRGSDKILESTGIGLWSVRKVAEAVGGTCGVVSTPGEGATFWVRIPANLVLAPVVANAPGAPVLTL